MVSRCSMSPTAIFLRSMRLLLQFPKKQTIWQMQALAISAVSTKRLLTMTTDLRGRVRGRTKRKFLPTMVFGFGMRASAMTKQRIIAYRGKSWSTRQRLWKTNKRVWKWSNPSQMFHVKHRGVGRGGIPLPPYPPLRIPSLTPYLCCLHIHRHGFFPQSLKKFRKKFSIPFLTLYILFPQSSKKFRKKFSTFPSTPPYSFI